MDTVLLSRDPAAISLFRGTMFLVAGPVTTPSRTCSEMEQSFLRKPPVSVRLIFDFTFRPKKDESCFRDRFLRRQFLP